jgi:hypothetical protein
MRWMPAVRGITAVLLLEETVQLRGGERLRAPLRSGGCAAVAYLERAGWSSMFCILSSAAGPIDRHLL